MSKDSVYWNNFYVDTSIDISFPSQFAAFVRSDISVDMNLIEFGCGNARDSAFFAKQGLNVIAIDSSEDVININSLKYKAEDRLKFLSLDPCQSNKWRDSINTKRANIIYSRFFIHALTNDQIELLLKNMSDLMNDRDTAYFEFRTSKDKDLTKEFDSHYRNYVDLNWFKNLVEIYGFNISYIVEGIGFAKYRKDDAYVARVKFSKRP